jgi:hypothetical protein
MNLFSRPFLSPAVVAAFTAVSASAIQSGQTVNPHGFPCGEHDNLNILGKKDGFACEQRYGTRETLGTATSSSRC